MLNLNKVGRPLAKIEGGKYNGMIVSVSDNFASNADEEEDRNGLIQEFRQLKIANDSKFQDIPDTTKEREIINDTFRGEVSAKRAIDMANGVRLEHINEYKYSIRQTMSNPIHNLRIPLAPPR
ncbi:MAG: hypothetical protein ACKPKO_62820, partial [Candidatus Fonsibacter sp.]